MTVNFRLFLIALAIVLACAATAVFGQTKPAIVPPEVVKLGEGLQTIHKGTCPRPGGDMLCMVGVHLTEPYGLMVLFNEHGVLVQVVYLDNVRKAESVLWTHPEYGT